jgi:hypothetical protein
MIRATVAGTAILHRPGPGAAAALPAGPAHG